MFPNQYMLKVWVHLLEKQIPYNYHIHDETFLELVLFYKQINQLILQKSMKIDFKKKKKKKINHFKNWASIGWLWRESTPKIFTIIKNNNISNMLYWEHLNNWSPPIPLLWNMSPIINVTLSNSLFNLDC